MEKEPDCQTNSNLRAATVPFEQIPDQSRIFLDFLRRAPDAAAFYPPIIKTHGELAWRAPEVLQNYTVDRNRLSDALRRLNTGWNASSAALANIEILRDTDAVAVVTGQQAGLFTGALYTIYKALSIIRVAKCLQARGVKAVPVFWIASEDHDFAEIAETFIADRDGSLRELKITTAEANENLPVGRINLDDSIEQTNARLFDELPRTELSAKLRDLILNAYQSPRKISDAFALLMAELFGKFGLILLDPLDGELKRLAAPIYVDAVRKSAEITAALLERGNALEAAGYHQQILIEKDYFPLFWFDENGKRQTLRRADENTVRVKNGKTEFTLAELEKTAAETPERLSPNATLRGAVQDYLLPTIGYCGGAGEIAYWAQTANVYQVLQRPVTTIFPRAGVTIIEPNVNRTFERYDLQLNDFFAKPELLQARIVERFLNNKTAAKFDETTAIINQTLADLQHELARTEPTLAASLTKRQAKIAYHIAALRRKFQRAEIEKDATAKRRLEIAATAVFPRAGLQERTLNIVSLLARHGFDLIDLLYNAIDVDATEHQILYL